MLEVPIHLEEPDAKLAEKTGTRFYTLRLASTAKCSLTLVNDIVRTILRSAERWFVKTIGTTRKKLEKELLFGGI